jgi:F0F1-type ATP synthase assembly protein I
VKNDDNNNKKQYDESLWTAFAIPTQMVIYIVGGAALGFLVGHFIDGKLNSTPVATFIGLLFGLAVGIYGTFRFVTKLK